jgi:hypothetical protein
VARRGGWTRHRGIARRRRVMRVRDRAALPSPRRR